ncbi:MAG: hypothetical protein K1X83_07490 [Oligoflexia bacterium]|nr:hypothetical protein [Oligoflexia bacterium]
MTPEFGRPGGPSNSSPQSEQAKQAVYEFLAAQGVRFRREEKLGQALSATHSRGKERLAHEHLAFVGEAALSVANAEILYQEGLPSDDGRLLKTALDSLSSLETRLHLARKAHLGRLASACGAPEAELAPQLLAAVVGAVLLDRGVIGAADLVRKLYGDLEKPASYLASLRLQFSNTYLPSVATCSHSPTEVREGLEIYFAPDKLQLFRDALGQERDEGQRKLRFSRVVFIGDTIVATALRRFISTRFPQHNLRQLQGETASSWLTHIDDFDRRLGRTEITAAILRDLQFGEFLSYRGYVRALIGAQYLAERREEAWQLARRFVPLLERPKPGSPG